MCKDRQTDRRTHTHIQTHTHTEHSRFIAVRSTRLFICRLYRDTNFSSAKTPVLDLFAWSGLALAGQPSHILSTF